MLRSQRQGDAGRLDDNAAAPGVPTAPVQPAPSGRPLRRAPWVILAVLVVAILKPWGSGAGMPTAPPVEVVLTAAPITPVPTEDRSAEGIAAPICLGAGGWRIATLERWQTQEVRVWRAIQPIEEATGPADPRIPSVPVVADQLTALGWCAPAFGPDRPGGPASVTAWSVRGGAATELRLVQTFPVQGSTPMAALYVPSTLAAPRAWTTERVTFRHVDEGSGRVSWLAADVTILPVDAPPIGAETGTP